MNVVLLAGRRESTCPVGNVLHDRIGLRAVILEKPVGKIQMLKARGKKIRLDNRAWPGRFYFGFPHIELAGRRSIRRNHTPA